MFNEILLNPHEILLKFNKILLKFNEILIKFQTGNINPLLCCLIPAPVLASQELGLALPKSAEMSETPTLPL